MDELLERLFSLIDAAMQRVVEALSYVDLYGSETVKGLGRQALSMHLEFHAAMIEDDVGVEALEVMKSETRNFRRGLVAVFRLDLGMHEFNIREERKDEIRKEYASELREYASSIDRIMAARAAGSEAGDDSKTGGGSAAVRSSAPPPEDSDGAEGRA